MTVATKNGSLILKSGSIAQGCGCCAETCNCPQNCTWGMQFFSPAQADIGVCGPFCAPTGTVVNPSCPPVTNTISDSGNPDSAAGRIIVSYTTTLDAQGGSNFRNGLSKNYTRQFLYFGFRSSIYASLRYEFVYGCSDLVFGAEPFMQTRAVLDITWYEGHSPSSVRYGGRSFLRVRNFTIDKTFYKCSPAEGRLCFNRSPTFNPTATKEFLPAQAVFNFSETAINDMPFSTTASNLFGDQSEITPAYNSQFSGFTAGLRFSERNVCNPLP